MRSASGSATEIGVRSTAPCCVEAARATAASLSSDFCAEALERAELVLGERLAADRRSTARRARRAGASRAFGPRPWMRRSATTLGGCFCAQVLELLRRCPVSRSSRILAAVLLPMPVDLLELLGRERAEIGGLRLDGLRGALVGAHPKRLRIALFEHRQLGELAEHVEDVLLRIGHAS